MLQVFSVIRDALAKQLHAAFAPVPVYFGEIGTTGDGDEEMPDDYIFVDLQSAGLDTLGPYRTDASVLVAITKHRKDENNREYWKDAEKIDAIFRPVFRFGSRAITVHNAQPKIVDRLLHYSFTVRFIPDQDIPVDEDAELMGDLMQMTLDN